MNNDDITETEQGAVDASELPPPVPPMPAARAAHPLPLPVPPMPAARAAHPLPPKAAAPVVPPTPPREAKDPAWWRLGSMPLIVLLLAAAVGDLAWPTLFAGWGIGAGIGCALLMVAMLLLRKDFTRGEQAFLIGLAVITVAALVVSGSGFNWVMALILPFLLCLVPKQGGSTDDPGPFRNWWSFWFARRKSITKSRWGWLRQILPTLVTVLVAIVLFILFLCIFASGNPVVELVWETIAKWWNDLVEYLDLNWDFVNHVLLWLFGIAAFGVYTLPRNKAAAPVPAVPAPVKEGRTILPHLPLASLIGINLAFLVATATDIAYLWFGMVPEGISQTAYLHEGAESITWAAVLASLILVFLFRRGGTARRGLATRIAGFALVVQTFLLAVSVYLRLYHQIDDMGFTTRRVEAAEAMLLGLDGLVILVCYMACSGSFWKFTRICLGSMLLLFLAFGICQPSELAASLNMHYLKQGKGTGWEFAISDFRNGRFDEDNNLEFAKYVYDHHKPTEQELQAASGDRSDSFYAPEYYSAEWFRDRLESAAMRVERKAEADTWTNWNWSLERDLPVARAILHPEPKPEPPAAQERQLDQPAAGAAGANGGTVTESATAPAAETEAPQPQAETVNPAPQPAATPAPAVSKANAPKPSPKAKKAVAKRITKAKSRKASAKAGSSKRVAKAKAKSKESSSSRSKRVASKKSSRPGSNRSRRARRHREESETYYYTYHPYGMPMPRRWYPVYPQW